MTVIVQVKRKPLMFGGCDLAQGGTVMYGWYMAWIWIFLRVFVNPKQVGRWTWILWYFSKFGPTWFSCQKKTWKKVRNHGLNILNIIVISHKHFRCRNRRVDSWQNFSFQPFFPEDPWWRFLDLAIVVIDAAPWAIKWDLWESTHPHRGRWDLPKIHEIQSEW